MKNQSRIICRCREPAAGPPTKKRCSRDRDDPHQKRARVSPPAEQRRGFFDWLPEDLILIILTKLSSSANNPSDLINVILTCRRLKKMAALPVVLSQVSKDGLGLKARNWNKSAKLFLKGCIEAGNLEACYILGMIYFYCFNKRKKGKSLITRATIGSHPEALYSLAIINFNGSGGSENSEDESAAIKLCTLAAKYGHINGLLELGYCFSSGCGVPRDVKAACQLLQRAISSEHDSLVRNRKNRLKACSLPNDFSCNVQVPEGHPANRFMVEWFTSSDRSMRYLRLCSNGGCGRLETRSREFLRCFVCDDACYCSRACQLYHWKYGHMKECSLLVWGGWRSNTRMRFIEISGKRKFFLTS